MQGKLPDGWKVFKVRGELFFAAADRIIAELSQQIEGLEGVILHMRSSSYLDAGGLAGLEKLLAHCKKSQTTIYFTDWQFQPLKTLARARDSFTSPLDVSYSSLDEAIAAVLDNEKNRSLPESL